MTFNKKCIVEKYGMSPSFALAHMLSPHSNVPSNVRGPINPLSSEKQPCFIYRVATEIQK